MNDDAYAPFLVHIKALRTTLFRIICIIAAGTLICFFNYETVFSLLKMPLATSQISSTTKIERLELTRFVNKGKDPVRFLLPDGSVLHALPSAEIATLGNNAFLIPTGATLLYYQPVGTSHPLVVLGPLEGLLTSMKISFWLGLFLTSPIWLFVLMQFLLPALHKSELKLLLPFVGLSLILIALGVLFAFAVTLPISNTYLFAFNDAIGTNLWSLENYLDYTLFLVMANGIAFELAAVGLFAVHLGLISAEVLTANRRGAILGAFILGALLTPPDVATQLMLAIPLIVLYELLILYAKAKRWRQRTSGSEILA